jgi:hypothetical protein
MDDDLQQLEAELKRLRPAGPSAPLRVRVGEALAPARPAHPPLWRGLWAAALPVAAAVAVMVFWPGETAPVQTARPKPDREPAGGAGLRMEPSDTLKPVVVENVLYAARDEGLVTLADGTPARRQRLNFVDTVTWKNPRTNVSLVWTVPREEVRVVPVVFQ